jgi:hypothetical protein
MILPIKIYWINLWIPCFILLPNLFFIIFKPNEIKIENRNKDNIILLLFERIGQFGSFSLPLFFEIKLKSYISYILILIILFLLFLYYACWIRFFIFKRKYKLLFKPFFAIPVPMAIFPVLFFILISIVERSVIGFIFSISLAIGHIPVTYLEYRRIK